MCQSVYHEMCNKYGPQQRLSLSGGAWWFLLRSITGSIRVRRLLHLLLAFLQLLLLLHLEKRLLLAQHVHDLRHLIRAQLDVLLAQQLDHLQAPTVHSVPVSPQYIRLLHRGENSI